MKKANITQDNTVYKNRILIENFEDLNLYFQDYVNPRFMNICRHTLERESDDIEPVSGDPIKRMSDMAISMQNNIGGGAIIHISNMEAKVKMAMLKQISKGNTLMCNPAGGWNFLNDDAIIEYLGDDEYCNEDIKLLKFKNGVHWYAKIKGTDVVIDGEQKWNAKWLAKKKAEQFLTELNQKS